MGWEPKVGFDELVETIVRADLERWHRWQKGEIFPWDAPNYPGEARVVTRSLKM